MSRIVEAFKHIPRRIPIKRKTIVEGGATVTVTRYLLGDTKVSVPPGIKNFAGTGWGHTGAVVEGKVLPPGESVRFPQKHDSPKIQSLAEASSLAQSLPHPMAESQTK